MSSSRHARGKGESIANVLVDACTFPNKYEQPPRYSVRSVCLCPKYNERRRPSPCSLHSCAPVSLPTRPPPPPSRARARRSPCSPLSLVKVQLKPYRVNGRVTHVKTTHTQRHAHNAVPIAAVPIDFSRETESPGGVCAACTPLHAEARYTVWGYQKATGARLCVAGRLGRRARGQLQRARLLSRR